MSGAAWKINHAPRLLPLSHPQPALCRDFHHVLEHVEFYGRSFCNLVVRRSSKAQTVQLARPRSVLLDRLVPCDDLVVEVHPGATIAHRLCEDGVTPRRHKPTTLARR